MLINSKSVTFKIEGDRVFATSRDIAAVFDKRHDNVIRDIEALPNDEYRHLNFEESIYEVKNPKGDGTIKRKFYNLTRDGFTLLAMGFTGAKAYQWKIAFINAFNRMEAELKKRESENSDWREKYNIPRTYADALHLAADQARQIEANNALIAAQTAEIEAAKPRIAFADRLLKAEGSLSLRDYAKVLCAKGFSIGEKRLFEKLRKIGILNRKNKPYQKYIEMGVIALKENTFTNPTTGDNVIYAQARITTKGQEYIYRLITDDKTQGTFKDF
jgi:anti-repressor protein